MTPATAGTRRFVCDMSITDDINSVITEFDRRKSMAVRVGSHKEPDELIRALALTMLSMAKRMERLTPQALESIGPSGIRRGLPYLFGRALTEEWKTFAQLRAESTLSVSAVYAWLRRHSDEVEMESDGIPLTKNRFRRKGNEVNE